MNISFLKKSPEGVSDTQNPDGSRLIVLQNRRIAGLIDFLRGLRAELPSCEVLLRKYDIQKKYPSMSDFRLGPCDIEKIPLDWILAFKDDRVVGHAMMARFQWDLDPKTLPQGWQGVVRQSYKDLVINGGAGNALVGMFINVEPDERKGGWSGKLAEEMLAYAKRKEMDALIIPLMLPQRYLKEYADMPYEKFAFIKREDGQYQDHWLRLHTRLGAKVLGVCLASHQHAMTVRDFYEQIPTAPFAKSGEHLVEHRDKWYKVHVDLERDFVLMNEGCVWVQHNLS